VHTDLVQLCDSPNSTFKCDVSGTTATVAVYKENKLTIAHVGDSRAVLACTENGELVAQRITRDHKTELEDEKMRIESSGGQVRKQPGDIPYRVYIPG